MIGRIAIVLSLAILCLDSIACRNEERPSADALDLGPDAAGATGKLQSEAAENSENNMSDQLPANDESPQMAADVAANGQAIPPLLDFELKDIEGKAVSLNDYRGKVIMLVNVASKCGHTPQYQALQVLHEKYAERGLAIIGIPCNDFGGQEPGSEEEIQQFCSVNYGVTFPLMSKVSIKGDQQHPLYAALTSREHNEHDPGPVKWNFEKFLISRDGKLAARFRSAVKPLSPEVVEAIEAELNKPAAK